MPCSILRIFLPPGATAVPTKSSWGGLSGATGTSTNSGSGTSPKELAEIMTQTIGGRAWTITPKNNYKLNDQESVIIGFAPLWGVLLYWCFCILGCGYAFICIHIQPYASICNHVQPYAAFRRKKTQDCTRLMQQKWTSEKFINDTYLICVSLLDSNAVDEFIPNCTYDEIKMKQIGRGKRRWPVKCYFYCHCDCDCYCYC